MAKKSKEEPELIVKTTEPDMFTLGDKNTMLGLWKVVAPTSEQVNQIIDLYRKYVNPNQPVSRDCGGCGGGLSKLYEGLRTWYSENVNKFPD